MRTRAAIITIAVICIALIAVALLVDLQTWIDWFSHPEQKPELIEAGARLWRIMLAITGIVGLLAAGVWMRLERKQASDGDAPRASATNISFLILMFIAGALLRILRAQESLWYDEIASWMTYAGRATGAGSVIGNFFDPINQPFHTLLNYLSVQWLAGHASVELAFRMPALVFSLVFIAAMFALGRAAFGERVGWIAAMLTAFVPVAVLEAAEARGYSMMMCFAALMTWALIEARRRQRAWLWALYALACALGIWAHFVTAFVPIGHGMWLMWRAVRHGMWREVASGGAALIVAAAVTITLYAPMIPGMLRARTMFSAVSESQPTILGPEGLHALLQLGGSWYWWAAVPGLMLLILGVIAHSSGKREQREEVRDSDAIELSTIGLPLMLIVVSLAGTWVYARFMLFVMPGAILLMALGIDVLWRWRPRAANIALLLVIAVSIMDLKLRPPKQPLRDAADFLRAHATHQNGSERVLVIGLAHPVLLMYGDNLNIQYTFMHGRDLQRAFNPQQPPDWIVVEYPRSVPMEVYELLARSGYTQATRLDGWVDWTNGDIVVFRFENRAKAQATSSR